MVKLFSKSYFLYHVVNKLYYTKNIIQTINVQPICEPLHSEQSRVHLFHSKQNSERIFSRHLPNTS